MITSTPTSFDPLIVNLVLTGLLERETTLEDLANRAGLELDQLLELIDLPPIQAKIQRLQRILDQRAKLLATAAESAAIASLTQLMEEAQNTKARREQLINERKDAAAAGDSEEAQQHTEELAELDLRFKKLTEAARSARATLTHARTRNRQSPHPQPAKSAPPREPAAGRPGSSAPK